MEYLRNKTLAYTVCAVHYVENRRPKPHLDFYRTMHLVQRGIAIVGRPYVCLSVCNIVVPWAYRLE